MTAAIIGASNKPDRYSYKALMLLKEKGYTVFPIHLRLTEIEGIPVCKTLNDIPVPVDLVTMYVSADISSDMAEAIIGQKPSKVIFNPGAENPSLYESLRTSGIEVIEACTLVMLRTGQL